MLPPYTTRGMHGTFLRETENCKLSRMSDDKILCCCSHKAAAAPPPPSISVLPPLSSFESSEMVQKSASPSPPTPPLTNPVWPAQLQLGTNIRLLRAKVKKNNGKGVHVLFSELNSKQTHDDGPTRSCKMKTLIWRMFRNMTNKLCSCEEWCPNCQ
jgi:hypothetical protein